MKKTKKNRVFISKIINPKPGLYMFWYQVHEQKRVIEKGNQKQMIANRQALIKKYQHENLTLGS